MEAPVHPQTQLEESFSRLRENDPTLTSLEIRYTFLRPEDTKRLGQSLFKNSTLEVLDMASDELNDADIRSMVDGMRQSQHLRIAKLNFSSNSIGFQGAFMIGILLQQERDWPVRILILRSNQIQSSGASSIAVALKSPYTRLEELDVSKNGIDSQGALALGEALKLNQSLKKLDISCNPLESGGMSALAHGLLHNESLEVLRMYNVSSGARGCAGYEAMLQANHTLKELILSANEIRCSGVKSIARGLAHNTTLKTLDLRGNNIGDTGVIALASNLQRCGLVTLNLSLNDIATDGAKALAQALSYESTKLREVYLRGNRIRTSGAIALASALKESNMVLEHLDIQNNRVDRYAVAQRDIRFLSRMNKSGRKLLRDARIPLGLWPHVLARSRWDHSVPFFFLREKPEIYESTVSGRSSEKRD